MSTPARSPDRDPRTTSDASRLGSGRLHDLLGVISLFAFSFLYFASAIFKARHVHWQADEVFVLWMVRDIPTNQLVSAVSHGLEWLPPTYYFYLKEFCRFAGPSPLALRLPAIVGFYVTTIAIYHLLRGRFGAPVAAFAAVFPCLTEAGATATLARPYSIMTACFSLSLLLWVRSDPRRPSWWSAAGIATLLAFAISVHFTSVFFLLVFGLLELICSLQTRVIRWPLWIAFATAGATLFLFWPVIAATHQTTVTAAASSGFYAHPSIGNLASTLCRMLTPPLLTLFLWIFLWIVAIRLIRRPSPQAPAPQSANSPDASAAHRIDLAAAGALFYPLIVFAIAASITHVFNGRYTYIFILGLSVLIAHAIRRAPAADHLCFQLTLLTVLLFCLPAVGPQTDPRVELMQAAQKSLPILASEATDFFELQESAPPSLRSRIFYSQMPVGVPNNDYDPERIAIAWKAFRPLQVVRAEQFFAQNPHFYLLYLSSDRERIGSWILERASVTCVAHTGPYYLLEVGDLHAGH